ncbi:hypothetical protein AKJ16_DCAP14468 [Drosera capensis]
MKSASNRLKSSTPLHQHPIATCSLPNHFPRRLFYQIPSFSPLPPHKLSSNRAVTTLSSSPYLKSAIHRRRSPPPTVRASISDQIPVLPVAMSQENKARILSEVADESTHQSKNDGEAANVRDLDRSRSLFSRPT